MPERPLLILPSPGEPVARRRRFGGGGKFHGPSPERQAERLTPQFALLQQALEARRARIQAEARDLVPEEVVVLETVGTVDNFIRAVEHIPGMEWLAEVEEEEIPLTTTFSPSPRTAKRDRARPFGVDSSWSSRIRLPYSRCCLSGTNGSPRSDCLMVLGGGQLSFSSFVMSGAGASRTAFRRREYSTTGKNASTMARKSSLAKSSFGTGGALRNAAPPGIGWLCSSTTWAAEWSTRQISRKLPTKRCLFASLRFRLSRCLSHWTTKSNSSSANKSSSFGPPADVFSCAGGRPRTRPGRSTRITTGRVSRRGVARRASDASTSSTPRTAHRR